MYTDIVHKRYLLILAGDFVSNKDIYLKNLFIRILQYVKNTSKRGMRQKIFYCILYHWKDYIIFIIQHRMQPHSAFI